MNGKQPNIGEGVLPLSRGICYLVGLEGWQIWVLEYGYICLELTVPAKCLAEYLRQKLSL